MIGSSDYVEGLTHWLFTDENKQGCLSDPNCTAAKKSTIIGVNLLVQKTGNTGVELWVTKKLNIQTGNAIKWFKVALTSEVASVDAKLVQSASYLGYYYDTNNFLLHGKDWIVKLPSSPSSETNRCVTSGMQQTSAGLAQK